MSSLVAVPLTLRQANSFVERYHRHHGPVRGFKLAVGAEWDGKLIAVALLGRPVNRVRQADRKLEVIRLCTDGVKRKIGTNRVGVPTFVNAASFLYARMRKIAAAMGCEIGTYILESEAGISVRAAGFHFVHKTASGSWDTPTRRREDHHPVEPKLLFEGTSL